jgi:hypothetical protein
MNALSARESKILRNPFGGHNLAERKAARFQEAGRPAEKSPKGRGPSQVDHIGLRRAPASNRWVRVKRHCRKKYPKQTGSDHLNDDGARRGNCSDGLCHPPGRRTI